MAETNSQSLTNPQMNQEDQKSEIDTVVIVNPYKRRNNTKAVKLITQKSNGSLHQEKAAEAA